MNLNCCSSTTNISPDRLVKKYKLILIIWTSLFVLLNISNVLVDYSYFFWIVLFSVGIAIIHSADFKKINRYIYVVNAMMVLHSFVFIMIFIASDILFRREPATGINAAIITIHRRFTLLAIGLWLVILYCYRIFLRKYTAAIIESKKVLDQPSFHHSAPVFGQPIPLAPLSYQSPSSNPHPPSYYSIANPAAPMQPLSGN